MTAEERRLDASRRCVKHWKRWGPYLAERAWGTAHGSRRPQPRPDTWEYFPHDHARSRAYRWNEDGLIGMCDRHQRICIALTLWNGRDPFLKERLFGVTNHEGNHGEDVKECYFYLDNTPTHSYMKGLYKYPQVPFPYAALVTENQRRGRDDAEYELLDTGIFEEDRYFDVLPTVWFRNTWSWSPHAPKPELRHGDGVSPTIALDDATYGRRWLHCDGAPLLLLTDNETNHQRLFGTPNPHPYVKDAFHRVVVEGDRAAASPVRRGTKAAAWYALDLAPGDSTEIHLRFTDSRITPASSVFNESFAAT